MYTRNRPGATPREVYTAIATDRVFRLPAIRLAEAQAARGVPSYMYLFTWPTPVFGGALKACHALELPFVFDNLDQPGASTHSPATDRASGHRRRHARHSAWTAFRPSRRPGWPVYEPTARSTMRFDAESEVVRDPMGDERELW